MIMLSKLFVGIFFTLIVFIPSNDYLTAVLVDAAFVIAFWYYLFKKGILMEIADVIVDWHYARNLIDGATDNTQTKKFLEEFTELVAACNPGETPKQLHARITDMLDELLDEGRIKTVDEDATPEAKKDAIGDMGVVAINIAERNGWSYVDCLRHSYGQIQHRTGRMVNGTYVKSEDL